MRMNMYGTQGARARRRGDVHGQHARGAPSRRPHTMVRSENGFLTSPSCAASPWAALSASVTCTSATSAAVRPAAGYLPRAARGARRATSSLTPRCSRNDPRTLLIALIQDGLGQPSCLSTLLSGPETAAAACHVAAPRLAAGAAGDGPERPTHAGPDWRTATSTAAAVAA